MQNIQNKIDKLITNGNDEFSKQRNVIAALVEYSRTLDLYDFMDRTYRIQIHEISVRIAICWDILGNFKNTLEYLNKALQIVPNVASLVLYKCVLLQTLGKTEEAQKTLIKYKQISGKKQQSLYETFRLVFFYSMNYERDLLLREIHEYLDKHPKNAVVLYLRAMIYMDLANPSEGRSNSSAYHKKNSSEFLLKYENDIKEAHQIEPTDTEFLMKDGITSENLTKLFFMILPEMDYYQPKPLVSYSTFHCGLKLFYIIFKVIRMLKIKVEKKKLKKFYNNKLKLYKKKLENSNTNNRDVSPDNSNNSLAIQSDNTAKESGIESANGTAINKSTTQGNTSDVAISDVNCTHNTSKDKIKLVKSRLKTSNVNTDRVPLNLRMSKNVNTIVNIKNNIEKETLDDMIKGIKKEFETKVKSLYRTVWVYNLKLGEGLTYNYEADVFTNYFIKYKYYAPFNLKESIVNGIRLNSEYKKDNSMHNISQSSMHKSPIIEKKSQIVSIKPNIPKPNEGRGLLTNGQCHNDKILVDLSVSEINYKHPPQTLEEHDSISFSSEVNILDRNESQDRKEINLNKDKYDGILTLL